MIIIKYQMVFRCECGCIFATKSKSAHQNHLKGTRHCIYLNGGDDDVYFRYTALRSALNQKCLRRSKNGIHDYNWTCLNKEVNDIVKELQEILNRYLLNFRKYNELHISFNNCYIMSSR